MQSVTIGTDTYLADYVVEDNTILSVGDEVEFNVGKLICGKNVEINISGGTLIARMVDAGDDFAISGHGLFRIQDCFECGELAKLYLEDIELELDNAVMTFGDKSVLWLNNCPIVGGRLVAGMASNCKIFGPQKYLFDNTEFDGGWNCDVAYPEWFVYKDTDNWSLAINKAFEISGTVFLGSRIYGVQETIWMPPMSRLIGECGGKYGWDSDYGTILQTNPYINFSDSCVIKINIEKTGGNATVDYPFPGSKIANIFIRNIFVEKGERAGSNAREARYGILVAFSAEFENLKFQNLSTAIRWTSDYADLKKVTRCNFDFMSDVKDDGYVVDFGFLGDALIFEGNMIGSRNPNGIQVNTCNSGIITSNIINADVHIIDAKGLTFSNNHMENGAQVVIDTSDVKLSNNFITKGSKPSVIVKSGFWQGNSVVELTGNQYIYYSDRVYMKNREKDKKAIVQICDYDIGVAGGKNVIENGIGIVTEYGVPRCILKISNEYRYWTRFNAVDTNLTAGIAIARSADSGGTFTGVEKFNKRSEILSRSSSVVFDDDCEISYPPLTIKDWSLPNIHMTGSAWEAEWLLEETGLYTYFYQIIIDYKRKWVSDLKLEKKIGSVDVNKNGVQFVLWGGSAFGGCVLVRMIRCKGDKYEEPCYADVPLVNAGTFYDDGLAICGYRWRQVEDFSKALFHGNVPAASVLTFVADAVIEQI